MRTISKDTVYRNLANFLSPFRIVIVGIFFGFAALA